MNEIGSVKPYRDFSDFIADYFPGKMQKLTVNAALGCPNRDGTIGKGGCIYCNNLSFSPSYTSSIPSVTKQLIRGKEFFGRKYPTMRYLAYFQSYTNTHGDLSHLLKLYEEALSVEGVDGIIIGTRPDCMPQELLKHLTDIAKTHFVMAEYGAESSHDDTLRVINRCHTWNDTVDAVKRTSEMNIPVGLHFINGLPGESEKMILQTVDRMNELPIDIVKFHQLQVIRGTKLASGVERGDYKVEEWSVEQYIELCCKILQHLRPEIAVERFVSQSPAELLISPRWGLKNYEFTAKLHSALRAEKRK